MCTQDRRVVAIIDDDAGVRDSLRFLLETAGHVVEVHESAVQFLLQARLAHPACLVLDQQMPLITGLDLVARLRARGVPTPALLLTSLPSESLSARSTELGVVVIEKPPTEAELLAAIAAALA